MLDGDYTTGFRAELHRKDARIVTGTAEEAGSPIPSFAVVAAAFDALVGAGGGDLDHAALVTLLGSTSPR